jgi:hypothetical protein
MMKFARLLVGAFVVIVALTMIAAPALALRSLQASNPGPQEGTGSRISFEEGGGFLRTVCEGLTLSGSGNERIAKRSGAAVGTITRGETTGCRAFGLFAATVTVEATAEAPWRVTYNAILGTLPVITGMQMLTEGVRFTIVAAGRTCRYEGRTASLTPVTREARGASTYTEKSALAEPKIRIVAGSSEVCPREGSPRGTMIFERVRTVTLVSCPGNSRLVLSGGSGMICLQIG